MARRNINIQGDGGGYRPETADLVRRKPNDASEASQLRSINQWGYRPPTAVAVAVAEAMAVAVVVAVAVAVGAVAVVRVNKKIIQNRRIVRRGVVEAAAVAVAV